MRARIEDVVTNGLGYESNLPLSEFDEEGFNQPIDLQVHLGLMNVAVESSSVERLQIRSQISRLIAAEEVKKARYHEAVA